MNKEIYEFFLINDICHENDNRLFEPTVGYYKILDENQLNKDFFRPRNRFSHKGDFGHSLLIAGSKGKGGACVLSAGACMKSGCGLLTLHVPDCIYNVVQISVPEAMVETDKCYTYITSISETDKYSSLGIGPGIGTDEQTEKAIIELLENNKKPIVIDADALNIIAKTKEKYKFLNANTIITPHPKEFARLFGEFASYKDKVEFMRKISMETGSVILLKGGITAVSCSDGTLYFNTTGNPGMATAGSGDVLTGIILGILSQGYSCEDVAKLGVYLHALSGDIAHEKLGEHSLIASDIVNNLPFAIMQTSKYIYKTDKV